MSCYYTVFGDRLTSSIPLPELRGVEPGDVRWRFQVVSELPEAQGEELLGEDPIYGNVTARLYRHSAGHRIRIDDTGTYDILSEGGEILWKPNPEPWWDFGRSHLIGRVLATSLQLAGTNTLHASAVEMADGVIGFIAPKHFGKSTLAMTLLRRGGRFVTDDSLSLDIEEGSVLARPGVQSLRVRPGDEDVERLLGRSVTEAPGRDGKVFLRPFHANDVLTDRRPVSALYFLSPRAPGGAGDPAERERVQGIPAALGLMGQTKIGGMLGPTFTEPLLDATATIVARVPVFKLSLVRDLDRLDQVVDHLVGWHGLPAGRTPAHG